MNPAIVGTPVPTPTLLPGLLILGTSLFRRKKESVVSPGEDWQGLA
ncbi:PTPA-CTERM sorting domain-containing protein [Alkalinema pantanalense CENA528]